ncbi:uncharacterized protein LOC135218944 [Macrobrachium nipponense]|uniref:uncharacterized protein LOC135218944 n=1 Tax=Macrobrachium nipponense TaxID=159736 RepID=UPI0030C7E717
MEGEGYRHKRLSKHRDAVSLLNIRNYSLDLLGNNYKKMMRFTVAIYKHFTKTRPLLTYASESILCNPKRYCPGICSARIVYWTKSVLNNASDKAPRSSFLMFCESQCYSRCRLDYREQKASGNRNRRLYAYPLFALALFQSKKDEEEEKKQESELIMMIKRGVLAIQRAELNKAEQLLHVALKTAQETQNHQAVTYIYDLLANVAYQKEEYSKAETLFKEVLKRVLAAISSCRPLMEEEYERSLRNLSRKFLQDVFTRRYCCSVHFVWVSVQPSISYVRDLVDGVDFRSKTLLSTESVIQVGQLCQQYSKGQGPVASSGPISMHYIVNSLYPHSYLVMWG